MIAALSDAGAAMGREDYLDAACACARFVFDSMRDPEGRLLRTWKEGSGRLNAYLEDHAFLVVGSSASTRPPWRFATPRARPPTR